MAAYKVSYKLRNETAELSKSEEVVLAPHTERVSASSATRAISQVANDLKNEGRIHSKADVIFLEATVVA